MPDKKKISLIASDDEELEDTLEDKNNGWSINKRYAERYDNWRNKEELQKCNLDFWIFSFIFLFTQVKYFIFFV